MNSKFFIDTERRSGIEDVDSYIELLESIVLAYTEDNATRLLANANRVIGILADDLDIIGEDSDIKRTKLIKAEKNNMIMDRIVALLKQSDVLSSISRKSEAVGKKIVTATKQVVTDVGEIKEVTDTTEEVDDLDEDIDNIFNSGKPAIEFLIEQQKLNKK